MIHFDDQAPLSKIGVAAMVLMMIGVSMVAYGIVGGLFDINNGSLPWDLAALIVGGVLTGISVKIACSKISYK